MPRKFGNLSRKGNVKKRSLIATNKKEIDKLKKIVKKMPVDLNQDYHSGATGISSVISTLTESLRSDKPLTLMKTTLRATYEDPENDTNILRFILFMYKCEVVSGTIQPPVITDVLEANDVRAPTNFENRKKIRVLSDRFYLQGGVSASETLNYNLPAMRYLQVHRKYGAGKQLKATKDNSEVWQPFMLIKNNLDSSGTYFSYNIANIYTGGDEN
jgi:hypothetical protein